jgi:hypothetical protein
VGFGMVSRTRLPTEFGTGRMPVMRGRPMRVNFPVNFPVSVASRMSLPSMMMRSRMGRNRCGQNKTKQARQQKRYGKTASQSRINH